MRALAAFIMKGRPQAILVIAGLAILSWIVSLASLLSTAAVALPTLRRGVQEGSVVIGAALLIVALAGWAVLGSPVQAVGSALVLWLPVWLVAAVLRESGQLGLALAATAALALLVVGLLFAVFDDPATLWLEELGRLFRPVLEQASSETEAERLRQNLAGFSRYLTGMVAAGSMLTVALGLLIGRWWQAMLFNPGGFHGEFLRLRLPAPLAYGSLVLLAGVWLGSAGISELAANLVIPLLMLFLLAGFAVLHGLFSGKRNAGFWLAGIYVAIVFLLPLSLAVLLIGFSDTWFDWRHRFAGA